MRRTATFGVRSGATYEAGGSDPIQTLEAPVTVLDATGGTDEQIVLSGDSIAKTTAPSRGIVSRDNICFAWGQVFVNVSTNTTNIGDSHNVASATWVSDSQIDITFHNAASTSLIAPVVSVAAASLDAYPTLFAATGFHFRTSVLSGSNYTFTFAVFVKDIS